MPESPSNPSTQGLVAIILAFGIAAAITALAIAAAIAEASPHITLSEGAVSLLSTALGAVVGAVATYVGTVRVSSSPPPSPGQDETSEDPTRHN